MNNLRLLRVLLVAVLLGGRAYAEMPSGQIFTLDQLFESADRNSVYLRPAMAAQQQAQSEIEVARAGKLPDVSANLSLSFIGDGFTTRRGFSDFQVARIPHFGNFLNVVVEQPVYTGGALTAGINLAELKLTSSRFATELQRDNIRLRLAGFYLDLYKYISLRQVVDSNLNQARKVLEQMHSRYEQGVALRNDITRYELLVSNLELQLVKIENTCAILDNNLAEFAGLPEGTKILPDTAILARALPVWDVQGWQAEASANSPAIALARNKVNIARKAEDIARARKLPRVGLQAAWSLEGPVLTEVPPINRNLSYWYVGVGVSYNLSSLYKSGRDMARSRAETFQASEELAMTCRDTDLAVRSEYIRYLETYEDMNTQLKSVELAERNYATVLTRYSADMALITDLLDAANARLEAEQNLVNARINIIYSYYKLLFISGKI